MATCGYADIPEFHRAEVMVAPALQSEGKQLQREQSVGMGSNGTRRRRQRESPSRMTEAPPRPRPTQERAERVHVPERSVPGAEPEIVASDRTAPPTATEEVLVLDFGGQYSQLIARRIRECGVFSELLPHDIPLEKIQERAPRALVLSGGPASVYAEGAPAAAHGAARARDPGAGHLLRDAADGPRARRQGRAGAGGRVRPHRR